MRNKSIDMTRGPILKSVILFALPLWATNIISQLFNTADLIVVGQFCGSDAVAAVGCTGSLVALLVNFFIGFSAGAGITVAQCYGSRNNRDIERAVHTVIPSMVAIGLFLTVVGLVLADKFLIWMGTPEKIIGKSAVYLRIYFCGIILRMMYVFGSAILRAVGDSQSPLRYLTLGGILNVGFNLFFVLVCHMDVDGVAYGTIISEGVSGFLCLWAIMRRTDAVAFRFSKVKSAFSLKMLKRIVSIGLPSGIQSSLYAISNVLVQSSINSFGSYVVAGTSAATNIGSFVSVTANSFSTASSNYVGQNYGAKNFERIKKSVKCIMAVSVSCLIVLPIIIRIFAKPLLGLYITDNLDAVNIGIKRISIITMTYSLCGIMEIYTAALRAVEKPFASMIIALATCCGVRVLYIMTLFKLPFFHHPSGIYAIYPVSWSLAIIADFFLFRYTLKNCEKTHKFKQEQLNFKEEI